MKKYSLHALKDDDDNFYYCVFEEATKQVTDIFYFPEEAQEKINFLERGGAFSGFTPSFILKEIKISNNKETLNSKVLML